MKKRILFVVILLGLGIPEAAFAQENTVKIGILYPMTGPLSFIGQECTRAAQIARDIVNREGGVWGKKVEFVMGDELSPQTAMAEAERLITVQNLKLISGGYSSSNSYAASDVCERNKAVFWITTAVGDPITSRGYKYLFRLNSMASQWGIYTADFLAEMAAPKLAMKPSDFKLAIIHEDSLFGTSITEACTKRANELGMKVVETIAYSLKTVDLSSEIMRLKAAKPDGILSIHYANDGNLLYSQMKEMNLNTKVLVGSIFFGLQQFQEKFGKLVNYVCVVDPPTPVESKKLTPVAAKVLEEFRDNFLKNYKIAPGDPGFTSFGGTYVLLKYLLPKAKSMDPEALRKAALELDLEDLTTPYGFGVKFAPLGHTHAGTNLRAYPAIMQWQSEKMNIVYPKKLAAKDVMLPMPTWSERK